MKEQKNIYRVAIFVAILVVFLGIVWVQVQNQSQKRYQVQFFDCFDTVTTITGYAKNQEEFSEKMDLLKEKLLYYHQLYDIYHTYDGIKNLKSINDAAGTEPVKVESEIIELLKFGKELYEKTGGKIHIAYGSVLSLWHDFREQGINNPQQAKLPGQDELKRRAEHTSMENLILDMEASTVYLADSKMSLDVGSIGKGYAVSRIGAYARELGMEHVLISVGGNVCAVGAKADGTPWLVGVENPDKESDEPYVNSLELSDASIVTSGDYQRYYEVDGRRYCHIIDPETGMPAEFFPSVTVMAEDSGMADAFSTALFVMGQEEGLALVEELEDVEALWVMEDGGIRCSSGFGIDEEE